MMQLALKKLANALKGELKWDDLHKSIYATDASVYRKLPLAVAFPKDTEDIKKLIDFATSEKTSLIPRTAGTSLAGQCVGDGIVVDVSKHFTKIISVDEVKKQVTVQPGVVRDELNVHLKQYGLFFGPNTSTSNRCMIGGMVGNNSSGTTSIQYGVTRDKIVSMNTILSDGSETKFESLSKEYFKSKTELKTLEGQIYKSLSEELSNQEVQKEIISEFPKPEIHRRNTGYAVDELLKTSVFTASEKEINICELLSGSEGTLAFTTEITLQLDELPPVYSAMIATHYNSIEDCLKDVVPSMQHNLYTCEMMDKVILDCTKNNAAQLKNRFFVEGDPKAILMLEVKSDSEEELQNQVDELLKSIQASGLSYASPVLKGNEINRALELRKAGLGLLGNIIGDKKAVACIEDTAVALADLPSFIDEFTAIMKNHNQDAVYYAHAGAGEIHLRPILNLKKQEDVKLFRQITTEVALLTKKYKGSFSGEHGDGIVRAEFIPLMIGEKNYQLLKRIKNTFDPQNIFNPGKIVDSFPMDESLRYEIDREEPEIDTLFDFSDSEGILKVAEKCNGSGDCRKNVFADGTMCPSYRATKDEKDTTRSRANALREVLSTSNKLNKFDSELLKESLDLCLSCKACASECPSNVDMASLKAEFQYQYQKANGYSFRNKLFAFGNKNNKLLSKFKGVSNFMFKNGLTSSLIKSISGIHQDRSFPLLNKSSFKQLLNRKGSLSNPIKTVYLFVDEFSEYLDGNVSLDAFELLTKLNYQVKVIPHLESARAFISKGFLEEAKEIANKNIQMFSDIITAETPLIGIEPSAILTFRDEYKRLANDKSKAESIAKNTFLIEEFLADEVKKGNIKSEQFSKEIKTVKIHNHCHQKALSNQLVTKEILSLPVNYDVSIINSGCCGMAGSFGYEKEHYDISMKIGEQILFPEVRNSDAETIIVANGTSCRHQIKDGTQKESFHPVSILLQSLS